MRKMRKIVSLMLLGLIVLSGVIGLFTILPKTVSAFTSHNPIYIDGNGDFTAPNGVTSGSGTIADPYIIEGWEISSSSTHGIQIHNTDAHFSIRDVYLHSSGAIYNGIFLSNVTNGDVQSATITQYQYGIHVSSSTNSSIRHNDLFNNSFYGISLQSSTYITVSENNVSSSRFYDGIYIRSSSNVNLTGNYISNNKEDGIYSKSSTDITITGNNITSNTKEGIYLSSSTKATLSNNNLSSNNGHGIFLQTSTNVTLISNHIWNSGGDGIKPESSTDLTITDNNISSNAQHGIYLILSTDVTISTNNLSSNKGNGITLTEANNTTLTDNKVLSNGGGISLTYSPNSTLRGNTISSSENDGISLTYSTNITISDNDISNNSHGVYVFSSVNTTLTGNSFSSNNGHGIYLYSPTNPIIIRNKVSSNNGDGINLSSADDPIIEDNIISSNNGNGIYLYGSGQGIIVRNFILTNSDGTYLDLSWNTVVYHNGFINNANQSYDNNGNLNSWDNGYPSGGNYWSDYTGVDQFSGPGQDQEGTDGIGDEPYIINTNSRDNYPLIEPLSINLDFNVPPVADFSYLPLKPTDLESVSFIDLSRDTDGTIISWFWDFDDGNVSTDPNPKHNYSDDGTYTVTLTVTDNNSEMHSISKEIAILNVGPNASAHVNKTVFTLGEPVSFTGLGHDKDGSIASWLWNFGDGNSSQSQNATHIYAKSGTYNVSLTVTDNDEATIRDVVTITVIETPSNKTDTLSGDEEKILDLHPSLFYSLIVAILTICIGILILMKKRAVSNVEEKETKTKKTKKKVNQKGNEKEWTRCTKCKERLKKNNLKSHIKKVHKKRAKLHAEV